ncbi:hypothetical protein E6O75_ATG07867 [Venturia nashicola]|uniref:Uncharacterized protein n=1 Tax=Venturia nashicola TaxID=86259 RepID=A0A4Z1NWT0_9PEZI|nr:hypothetical protein E6O75_ATG07867 [Venturia nashicola]
MRHCRPTAIPVAVANQSTAGQQRYPSQWPIKALPASSDTRPIGQSKQPIKLLPASSDARPMGQSNEPVRLAHPASPSNEPIPLAHQTSQSNYWSPQPSDGPTTAFNATGRGLDMPNHRRRQLVGSRERRQQLAESRERRHQLAESRERRRLNERRWAWTMGHRPSSIVHRPRASEDKAATW